MTTTWSQLAERTRVEIVEGLKAGQSPYILAPKYNLHPGSLARKWRYIKKNLQQTSSEVSEEIHEINSTPTAQDIFKTFDHSTFYGKILGNVESFPNDRFMFITTRKPLRILFYTDTHFNQHDQQACDTFIRIAQAVPHDVVVHGGDPLECYGLSKYGKDPYNIFRNSFKAELAAWHEFNEQLNDATDVPKLIIAGNHFERYFQWLKSNPAVMAIDAFDTDNLLSLEKYNYEPMVNSIFFDADEYGDFPDPGLLATHGDLSRRFSGNSARGESERRGWINTMSGHKHSAAVTYRRTMRGQSMALEGGTLRTLNVDWMSYPDWQHSASIVHYNPITRYVTGTPILIVGGEAWMDGKRI